MLFYPSELTEGLWTPNSFKATRWLKAAQTYLGVDYPRFAASASPRDTATKVNVRHTELFIAQDYNRSRMAGHQRRRTRFDGYLGKDLMCLLYLSTSRLPAEMSSEYTATRYGAILMHSMIKRPIWRPLRLGMVLMSCLYLPPTTRMEQTWVASRLALPCKEKTQASLVGFTKSLRWSYSSASKLAPVVE